MSDKDKLAADDLGVDHAAWNVKPSSTHIEDASQDVKIPRTPYWDTEYVIGANRNTFSTNPLHLPEEDVQRHGYIKKGWLHFKRHLLLYTIALLIFLAIGLPVFILKIFPAIAQRLVDDAYIPIHSASIMSPTPHSVVYSLQSTLEIPAGVSVDLKPIVLSLFTNESNAAHPYIRVILPEYHLKGKTNISITNQTAEILDQEQFRSFLVDAVNSKQFTLAVAGSTVAYLGVLKAPIKLNKHVDLKGLNSLVGFSFTSAAVVFPAEADGTNLRGTVSLPNPTVVTFELGNVTLNMLIGDIVVGKGRLENVLLAPGNNSVPIKATFDLKAAIQNLPVLLAAEGQSLTNGNVMISASGNSTIYNGFHIPYYEAVLNSLVITGEVPLIKILIDSLQHALGGNNTLISDILGALNSTNLLSQILGELIGKTSSLYSSSSTKLLPGLGL